MNRRWRAALALIAASFVTGGWLVQRAMRPPAHRARLSASEGARLFESVMKRVQKNWVDSISVDEIYRRAAIGVVSELGDPSSSYLPPERLKRLREVTSGSYRGVGLSVDLREGWIVVIQPRLGSPAEHAGIRAGDRLVELNGQSMRGWTVEEARDALRDLPMPDHHADNGSQQENYQLRAKPERLLADHLQKLECDHLNFESDAKRFVDRS